MKSYLLIDPVTNQTEVGTRVKTEKASGVKTGGSVGEGGIQSPAAPLTTIPTPKHGTMQYSLGAEEPGSQPCSQTGRIQPKGALHPPTPPNLLHTSAASSSRSRTDPCLSKLCSDYQNLISPHTAPTNPFPLTQRANVPLKMHILAAHPIYLMHMHHTSGTEPNDIASDTEYPSSDIQFRFLQEEAAGFPFFPSFSASVQACRLNLGRVRSSTC